MTYSLEACRGCGPAIILPVGAIDDLHTAGGESMPQPLVVRRVYRAAQIPDDGDAQTVAHRILGAPSHAVIAREPADEDLAHAVILEVTREAGRRPPAARIPVVAQRAVRIHLGIGRLANNRRGLVPWQVGMKPRALGALHTMIRPQRLLMMIE